MSNGSSFLPTTLVDLSTILANGAIIVGALYTAFKAIPRLATALKNIARRDANSAVEAERGKAKEAAKTASDADAFKEQRVADVFAMFEVWKAKHPIVAGGVRAGLLTPDYEAFLSQALGSFDLMLVDLPASRADHWRLVIIGELVKHAVMLSGHYQGKRAARYSPELQALIGEAIDLGLV